MRQLILLLFGIYFANCDIAIAFGVVVAALVPQSRRLEGILLHLLNVGVRDLAHDCLVDGVEQLGLANDSIIKGALGQLL